MTSYREVPMAEKRAQYLINGDAWTWLADLDPAAFYWGPENKVNYGAIARRAGLARTVLTKTVNGDQSLTLDVFTALINLAVEDYGVDEDAARRALFTLVPLASADRGSRNLVAVA